LSRARYLLDVNVLIALTEPAHARYRTATKWFAIPGLSWGMCAFSEAGFLRLTASPSVGRHSVAEGESVLTALTTLPGYRYWPIAASWATLVAPFRERLYGHQQITDALLLGLAIKENGVLVTLDRAIKSLAGPKYSANVLVLE
jgi:hypothetical protein